MLTKYINIERFIHSTKTVIACITGFMLTKIISFPADQWVVITIIVVMCAQIYVGSVLQKAYLRFLGTLIGCLFAATTIAMGGHTTLGIALTLGASSFIFSYIATGQESLSYAGTLGAVTTAIIMLGQTPTVLFAFERFLEISVGIFIATVISQYILPIHARTHLRRSQAETLQQLRDFYLTIMTSLHTDAEVIDLDESIAKSLLRQRQLAKESARERLRLPFNTGLFMQSLYCEREIQRAIIFMHNALTHAETAQAVIRNSSAMEVFNKSVTAALNTLIDAIASDDTEGAHLYIPSLSSLKEEMLKLINPAAQEETIYLYGYLYSAEILTISLTKLARLLNIQVSL